MPVSKSPFPRRKSSSTSPFTAYPRKKPSLSRQSSSFSKDKFTDEQLSDTGLTPSLAPSGITQDVMSLIRHVQEKTWDPIPEVSGMNSSRIAETLRYRETLPPVVSLPHLYALSVSPTETERGLARLVAQGVVRKTVIPGRAVANSGGSVLAEGAVVINEWKALLRSQADIDGQTKDKYFALMDPRSGSTTTPTTGLERDDIQQLVRAGFLTNPTAVSNSASPSTLPGLSSLLDLSKAGHSAPTGSLAAVGGRGAVHESGGGGSALSTQSSRSNESTIISPEMTFSLPNTGAYLKLLSAARLHLVHLLRQLSPRHKEATRDLLKERWEGNTLGDAASVAKRARGEWNGVLPGKTKKWREFHGLRFEWVLEECVGCGVVEVFETGMGVMGVRAR
ncbi:hypothetical protein LTR35_010997 [Friedmanniomyces endolithicus]|uniref:Serine-threonine protein kinase 19 n=1 Tax=Friedmanniomyces endolithicus TaxID=329885 RepID=A0AAN6J559_9PEZI|nr:hypothetical protein LTR35_010997 [Friedmanniomyces endolithicus]KAK0278334.1 hypothetical protein LTS00_013784 [Friedmanniomyces endolithicus]KAK0316245.1 hypothetical protein LTR82_012273 [Friedmanniomyces endolithicus]KAK0992486.1 hypothetical protein LTR54_011357 [Friedmanniomyces endolithicus]